ASWCGSESSSKPGVPVGWESASWIRRPSTRCSSADWPDPTSQPPLASLESAHHARVDPAENDPERDTDGDATESELAPHESLLPAEDRGERKERRLFVERAELGSALGEEPPILVVRARQREQRESAPEDPISDGRIDDHVGESEEREPEVLRM